MFSPPKTAPRGQSSPCARSCRAFADGHVRVTTYKYILRLKTTGEVVGKYHRRPSFAKYLKRMALKGRPDTLGQLELAPYEE